jgi:hypothetical protein
MNERIWKLAEQIVCFEQDMDGSMEPNEDGQWIRVDELEKFAQLIVRECAEVANEHDCNLSGNAGEILNHFGVEDSWAWPDENLEIDLDGGLSATNEQEQEQ